MKQNKCGTVGPILETSFEKAIKTGRKVRVRTRIDKGAVSIGSAAVDLLEEALGDLKDKRIIVIGAGETGGLVGKALASREHAVTYVANRTYKRGVRLARMLGGQAVRFNKVKHFLACVDAAIVATAAPHHVLTKKLVQEALDKRKSGALLIMDLSQPRNVEESVANLPNVELHDIDDLRGIAEVNRKMRRREIKKVEIIVQNELKRLELTLKRKRAEPLISALCNKAEEIRRKELNKALKMLGKLDDDQRKVVDDLTMVLVKRILHHPFMNLRKAAVSGDIDTISATRELFNISSFKGGKRSDLS
ncbi:MAG: glutamyl-tRNA reductase [Candidatus Korarchaeota archaeon]|nr:glutamyl-tRNA reductase [Candidatus Korarchaeota archaeon]